MALAVGTALALLLNDGLPRVIIRRWQRSDEGLSKTASFL